MPASAALRRERSWKQKKELVNFVQKVKGRLGFPNVSDIYFFGCASVLLFVAQHVCSWMVTDDCGYSSYLLL